MRPRGVAVVAVVALVAGCGLLARLPHPRQPPPPAPPTFSQYHLDGWSWEDQVSRVVVLPILNESPHTRAGAEVAAALTSELQKFGRFEVVLAPPDNQTVLAASVHRGGRFDEAVMLEVGRITKADVLIHGTITHYSPYPRPRLGLILQAVGPREAKVVASVDGLWDATDLAVAWRCRTYYRQTPRERPPWLRNSVIANDDSFAAEMALESPALFQRFVCHEASLALLGLPIPGIATPGTDGNGGQGCATPALQKAPQRTPQAGAPATPLPKPTPGEPILPQPPAPG